MTLAELSEKFVALSGRIDLVNDQNLPPKFWINQGQRLLDRMVDTRQSAGRWYRRLDVGDIAIALPNLRSILGVWVMDGDSRTKLTRVSINELRLMYPNRFDKIEPGRPLFYCMAYLRLLPNNDSLSVYDWMSGYGDVVAGDFTQYNGILFCPPASENLTIEVIGKFFSRELVNDTDTSFWSETHPMLLLHAALYQLEVSYRNSEGAADWMAAIKHHVDMIDRDMAEEEQADLESELNG